MRLRRRAPWNGEALANCDIWNEGRILKDIRESTKTPPISVHRKISHDRLEDSIENYAEVYEVLLGSAFEEYLNG